MSKIKNINKPARKTKQRQRRQRLLRVVTNSERGSFGCQRRWDFAYQAGLTSSMTPAPLKQGTLVHQCLGVWYESGCTLSHAEIVRDMVGPWLEGRLAWAETAFEDSEFADSKRAELIAEDHAIVDQSTVMLEGYINKWSEVDSKFLEVIAVEPQMARWLIHPVTGKTIEDRPIIKGERRRRRWSFGGGVDVLVRDKRDGQVWAMEHKTTSDKDLNQYLRKLHFDPQTRGYAWALADPIPGVSGVEPVQVAGVIYNALRKKVPAIPHLLKNKKGLSKASNIDTTRDVYLKAIIDNGFDPDDYVEILDKISRNQFFAREAYAFSAHEIADFEQDMTHAALQICEASKPGTYHPRQVSACMGVAAYPCRYRSICLEDGNMARASFRVKGIRHEELSGELAEPYAAQERGLELSDLDPQKQIPTKTQARASDQPASDPDDPFAVLNA